MSQKSKQTGRKTKHIPVQNEAEEDSDMDTSPFGVDPEALEEEEYDTRKAVMKQNRKNKKSGGFQSMGLCYGVLKGVLHKGYKLPTPIQRKCIPLVMDGKDVVAMARTGSGKTAAFLVPMFERLQTHQSTGARALVLSPTRELSLQTLKFAKDLGKYTGLKAAVILGGDRMEDQFAALHENPDIIVATPGRLMHVLVEMGLKLQSIEYLVFDEADRLFEMGFSEQLHEILHRVPDSRQTLLFSATLPKLLVEFARAGLHDPTLVRLDVDTKLSENLKMSFAYCRQEEKTAMLLYLLQHIIPAEQQAVVFVATKHHAEYLNMILSAARVRCGYTYSSLDQTMRKIQVAKFRSGKCRVLLVTDLAARGIDIPLLDNVINYNFPAKPKLFVHRVGRVARAGRTGTAISLVAPDELAYVYDLHLFLGRSVTYVPHSGSRAKKGKEKHEQQDGLVGRVPQSYLLQYDEDLTKWHELPDIEPMRKVIDNAYKQYIKSRPNASSESVKRAKQIELNTIGYLPMLGDPVESSGDACAQLIEQMKSYKPKGTIFEINATSRTSAGEVMRKKRSHHDNVIAKQQLSASLKAAAVSCESEVKDGGSGVEQSTEDDIEAAFSKVIGRKRKARPVRDEENYVPYRPKDIFSEKGLSIGTSFESEVATASFDLTGDEREQMKTLKNSLKWDRKRKKFVGANAGKEANQKKIKTESGQWIKASYKTNAYNDWMQRNKVAENQPIVDEGSGDEESRPEPQHRKGLQVFGGGLRRTMHRRGGKNEPPATKHKFKLRTTRREMKRPDQILKERRIKSIKEDLQRKRAKKNQQNRARNKSKKK